MIKYCPTCGREVQEHAVICVHCGCKLSQEEEKADTGLVILSFLVPLVGLILFCMHHETKPAAAKSYGIWALVGVAVCVCLVWLVLCFAAVSYY